MKVVCLILLLTLIPVTFIYSSNLSTSSNPATVTIYRPQKFFDSLPARIEVVVNQEAVFRLDGKEYAQFQCGPGEYLFYFRPATGLLGPRSGLNGAFLCQFEAGKHYFIEIISKKLKWFILYPDLRPDAVLKENADLSGYIRMY